MKLVSEAKRMNLITVFMMMASRRLWFKWHCEKRWACRWLCNHFKWFSDACDNDPIEGLSSAVIYFLAPWDERERERAHQTLLMMVIYILLPIDAIKLGNSDKKEFRFSFKDFMFIHLQFISWCKTAAEKQSIFDTGAEVCHRNTIMQVSFFSFL